MKETTAIEAFEEKGDKHIKLIILSFWCENQTCFCKVIMKRKYTSHQIIQNNSQYSYKKKKKFLCLEHWLDFEFPQISLEHQTNAMNPMEF